VIHTFPGHQKGRRVKFLHSIRPFAIAGILASILTSGTTFGQTSGIAPQSPLGVTDLSSVHLNRPTLDQLYLADKEQFFPSLLGLGQFGSKAISTRHFDIYYFGASNTAARIAKIADEKLETIGRFYPGFMDNYHRLTVVVLDDSDVLGNAFASTTNNLIVFWSSPYDITERGSSKWVENVFVHELTHSITHRAANKEWPFRFGFLGTNRSNQNPDFVFNIPLYNKVFPSWYSEGVAQFEATENGDDTWDTHRDMKLRMAVLEDDMLTLDGMSFFGHNGEMVYNQGFGFLNYISETYGADKVRAMNDTKPIVSFGSAIRQATGVGADQVYREWKGHLENKYGDLVQRVQQEGEREGELLYDDGSMDFHPVISPDGLKMAFLSNEGADFALTVLKVMDLNTRKVRRVADGGRFGKYVFSRISWSPDSESIYYMKARGGRWDLFTFDLMSRRERRVSASLRGRDPAVSPDGQRIVYVRNEDGSNSLGLVTSNGVVQKDLITYNDGTQIYGPKWSPDGKQILFTLFHGEDRDIVAINADATPVPDRFDRFRLEKEKEAWEKAQADKKADKKEDSATEDNEGEESDDELEGSNEKVEEVEEEWVEAVPDTMAYSLDTEFTALVASEADERDAAWTPDGRSILYSSDRTGVFNVYIKDLETGEERQVTNVIGGAFVPSMTRDGNEIVYAGYHASNYSIYRVPVANAASVASTDNLEREYRELYTGPGIDDVWTEGKGFSRMQSRGFVPFINVGPTFIGNRFGLDEVSGGAQASWGQLLGNDALTVWSTIGKNFRRGVDLNTQVAAFYQKGLPSIHNENGAISPSIIIGGTRQTINSLIDFGAVAAQRDTMTGTLQAVIDSQTVLIPNATQFLNLTLEQTDTFKDVFNDFVVGTSFRLGQSQSMSLFYTYRSFKENLRSKQTVLDSTRTTAPDGNGNVIDITDDLGGTNTTTIVVDDFIYQDLRFYKSHDLSLGWNYTRFKPTFDRRLNPTGGRSLSLVYRRVNATITDSLALSIDLNQDSVPDPTVTEVSPTLFRADNAKLALNEYIASWNEFLDFPGRTTLSFQAFVGYKDQPIKEAQQGGGTFEGVFYYPLRYYLGGLGTLRGYPYFSLSGGKVVFGRANFTFPIFNKKSKELSPFTFSKLYGSFFFETGATGNAKKLSEIDFSTKPFLSDVGFELRMEVISNYIIPMFGFFQIAWPLDKTIPDRNDPTIINTIDDFRIYFGLSI
jgi:Tol biopolymer transport system component